MLYSMTGFGKAEGKIDDKQITVEIKSLNGKQFEFITRLNPLVKAYEIDLRSVLQAQLIRGTIDINISIRQDGSTKPMTVNKQLAITYYHALMELTTELSLKEEPILSTIMRMPEVVTASADGIDEKEWEVLKNIIQIAITQLISFRDIEGQKIEIDITERVKSIESLLSEVTHLEGARVERIRERITNALNDVVEKDKFDQNRLEQEMVYYIEKIDISEEKQRLKSHIDYFFQLLNDKKEAAKGKKLGFVVQEIGREINTLGSKANDAAMQQIVVNMKDELEKVKEQILNIL